MNAATRQLRRRCPLHAFCCLPKLLESRHVPRLAGGCAVAITLVVLPPDAAAQAQAQERTQTVTPNKAPAPPQ
ncbi:MAG: hypothetical protein MUF54_19825, partial [Polyangiaceae bacterium]|nr:hypothetical protein [Polyangiaceae bacterium]